MDIEFLDCEYEIVDLDENAPDGMESLADAIPGEAVYLDWFTDSASRSCML